MPLCLNCCIDLLQSINNTSHYIEDVNNTSNNIERCHRRLPTYRSVTNTTTTSHAAFIITYNKRIITRDYRLIPITSRLPFTLNLHGAVKTGSYLGNQDQHNYTHRCYKQPLYNPSVSKLIKSNPLHLHIQFKPNDAPQFN